MEIKVCILLKKYPLKIYFQGMGVFVRDKIRDELLSVIARWVITFPHGIPVLY